MPELSLSDIDLISNEIRNQGITFSHLPDDLIDHVCCDVENEMMKGFSFPEAYQIVKQKMDQENLMRYRKETLYAVDTKYRKMKNTMKISGIAVQSSSALPLFLRSCTGPCRSPYDFWVL